MIRLTALITLLPLAGHAITLDLPSNAELASQTQELRKYELPLGPWTETEFPVDLFEGQVTRQVWRIPTNGLTNLQILSPLRDQLVSSGFEILLDCDTAECGGYDFRYATEAAPAPLMQIALGDFRFVSARKDGEALSLFISRNSRSGFVQVIRAGGQSGEPVATTTAEALSSNAPVPMADDKGIASQLETAGSVILGDLSFETGSAQLGSGTFTSLIELAAYLEANPDRRIALVGHTDTKGSLEGNIALSKRRAGSVLERLVTDYDASRGQLDAEGMGYLAPVSANLDDAGREANRRVEAVLLSTE